MRSIEDKIKQTAIIISDPTCSQGKIYIELSAPVDMLTPNQVKYGTLTLFQDNSAEFIKYYSRDGRKFEVTVDLTRDLVINYYDSAYRPIQNTIHSSSMVDGNSFKFGLIAEINNVYVENTTKKIVLSWHTVRDQAVNPLFNYIIDKTGTDVPIDQRYSLIANSQPSNSELNTLISYQNLTLEGFPSEYKNFVWTVVIPSSDNSIDYRWSWQTPKVPYNHDYQNIQKTFDQDYVMLGNEDIGYIFIKSYICIIAISALNITNNIAQ